MTTIEYGSRQIDIDWANIRSGLAEMSKEVGQMAYAELDENDRGIVSVGMIPQTSIDRWEQGFREMVSVSITRKLESLGIPAVDQAEFLPDDLYRDFGKHFTLGMLEAARNANALIV